MKPNARIDRLFAQTKPVCFGRFLIEVPITTEVVWGPTHAGWEISSYPGEGSKIAAETKDKEDALKEEKHIREPSTYIGTFDGPNPQSKIVVGYKDFESSGLVQLHSYIRLGRDAFVQSASIAALEELPDGKTDKSSYMKHVGELRDIARRLRVRDEREIPIEPGLCIEAGFLSDGIPDVELTSIGFRFPEYPDVSFSIQTIKTDRPDYSNSLEWSLKKGEEYAGLAGQAMRYVRGKVFRKGERTIGDWSGAEQLGRMPSEGEAPSVHDFLFKSIGVAKDAMRPIVSIELNTGVDGNTSGASTPSLKDEDAIALWDRLTATIRARPVQGGGTPAEATPVTNSVLGVSEAEPTTIGAHQSDATAITKRLPANPAVTSRSTNSLSRNSG